MLKVRFRDIAMAKKAISAGLCMYGYHLSTAQIEQEQFYSITPCWRYYKYDHQVRDYTETTMKCSECGDTGHTFRECKNRDRQKCLNCEGAHRTLAASCPVRRGFIKKKRDESNKRKGEEQDRTYAAVAKLQKRNP